MRRLPLLALLLAAATPRLAAQSTLDGTVRDRGAKPLSDVRVRALRSARTTITSRFGAFRLDSVALPDTLILTAVGFRPDTVKIASRPEGRLNLVLERLTLLEELAVSAEREPQVARATEFGEWSLGQRAIRAAPAVIEADVMRSLILVPAVSFSSVLSARPLVRGYESNLTAVRVDGFEVVNLYRVGRFLSSFPADATERVTVVTPPGGDLAPGVAGHIDMAGRRGRSEGFGGGGLSFGSLGAYGGARPGGVGAFGAMRFLHISGLANAAGKKLPATFVDAYGRLDFGSDAEPRGSLSAFYSGDEYGHVDRRDEAQWHSLLVGGRYELIRSPRSALTLEASASRFHQDTYNGPTQRANVDVRTRLELGRLGLAGRRRLGRVQLEGGASVTRRRTENLVRPLQFEIYRDLGPYQLDATFTETQGFGSLRWSDSTTTLSAGARLEHSPWASTFSPRIGVEHRWSKEFSAGVGVGRTAALHQYVSDPASEPDLAFYDYWIIGGRDGLPAPRIDHGSIDARWARGPLQIRATGFLSRGRGLVEVTPPSAQAEPPVDFRVGRSRTEGLELQATLSPPSRPDRVASLTWVLSRSRRDWGQGWIPWALDRRNLVRLQLATTIARRWRVDVLTDYTGSPPYTPVTGILPFQVGLPGRPGLPFIYGPENSARDISRFRVDMGFTHHFNGPGKSRLLWGISLLNITWGPVVPLLSAEGIAGKEGIPLGYDRLKRAPFAPSLTLLAEF